MGQETILIVDGEVERPLGLKAQELASLPPLVQVPDVSRFHPKRRGAGVTLQAILDLAGPRSGATYLTLHADRDDFHASIPLDAVRGEGIVVYRDGDEPLSIDDGGPFRFLIRDPAACHTDELDDCANVKYLSRLELTTGRGRDNRPKDDQEHERLHQG